MHPIRYSVSPPYAKLTNLLRDGPASDEPTWIERMQGSARGIGYLTSVDGATVITNRYEVLGFGAKIRRRDGCSVVEQVMVTEPVRGAKPHTVAPGDIGGTRHSSAAQFAHDQQDGLALVASQDGHYTVFAWSDCEGMVQAHRIEALLL